MNPDTRSPSGARPTNTSSFGAPGAGPPAATGDAVAAVLLVSLALLAAESAVLATLAVEAAVAAWYLGPPLVSALVRTGWRPGDLPVRRWLAE